MHEHAFLSLGLAIAANLPRALLAKAVDDASTKDVVFAVEAVSPGVGAMVYQRYEEGTIMAIVPEPFPILRICVRHNTSDGGRSDNVLYGFAKRQGPPVPRRLPRMLSREEAIAKGIPMPDETAPMPAEDSERASWEKTWDVGGES